MKRALVFLAAGLLLFVLVPSVFAEKAVWPPSPGLYLRKNEKGACNGGLLVFHRPEGVFVSLYGMDYEGDESGLIPAMERGGARKLEGAGMLQMGQTAAEAALKFLIERIPDGNGDEVERCCFPGEAYYRMEIGVDDVTVTPLKEDAPAETVDLGGRYERARQDPVVNEALAAFAVTYLAGGEAEWDFSAADRWGFDILPAGTYEGIGRLRPAMRVDVFFGDAEPECSFLVTNDLTALFRVFPEPPVRLAEGEESAG